MASWESAVSISPDPHPSLVTRIYINFGDSGAIIATNRCSSSQSKSQPGSSHLLTRQDRRLVECKPNSTMTSNVMAPPSPRKFLTKPPLCANMLNFAERDRQRRNFIKKEDICCLPCLGVLHCQVPVDSFWSTHISGTGRNLPSELFRV